VAADGLARADRRLAEMRETIQGIFEDDARNVALAKHMFETDEELVAAGLKPSQIRRVRSWELSKKEVAAGLAASSARLEALAKNQVEKPTTINIERAVIQVPAPGAVAQSNRDAVYIDVEPGK
jgi:hypothetical protein